MSTYSRARSAPSDIAEACEIAEPLVRDVRLRDEEREAIEMIVAALRKSKPSTRWVSEE